MSSVFNLGSVENPMQFDTRIVVLRRNFDTLTVGRSTGGNIGVMARSSGGLTRLSEEHRKSNAY